MRWYHRYIYTIDPRPCAIFIPALSWIWGSSGFSHNQTCEFSTEISCKIVATWIASSTMDTYRILITELFWQLLMLLNLTLAFTLFVSLLHPNKAWLTSPLGPACHSLLVLPLVSLLTSPSFPLAPLNFLKRKQAYHSHSRGPYCKAHVTIVYPV